MFTEAEEALKKKFNLKNESDLERLIQQMELDQALLQEGVKLLEGMPIVLEDKIEGDRFIVQAGLAAYADGREQLEDFSVWVHQQSSTNSEMTLQASQGVSSKGNAVTVGRGDRARGETPSAKGPGTSDTQKKLGYGDFNRRINDIRASAESTERLSPEYSAIMTIAGSLVNGILAEIYTPKAGSAKSLPSSLATQRGLADQKTAEAAVERYERQVQIAKTVESNLEEFRSLRSHRQEELATMRSQSASVAGASTTGSNSLTVRTTTSIDQ